MYPLFISLRYLLKKRVTLICIAGVAVGVMALTVVLSVMNGFIRDIRSHVRGTMSDMVVVSRLGPYALYDYERLMAKLRRMEHVKACAPYIEGIAIAKFDGGRRQFVQFRGVVPKLQAQASEWDGPIGKKHNRLLPGRTIETVLDDTEDGKPTLFGGEELFRCIAKGTRQDPDFDPDTNFVPLGSKVVLVTVTKSFSAGVRAFRLSGLFKTGMYEFDDGYVYIALKHAQDIVGTKGGVSGICLKLDDYAYAPQVKAAIEDTLGPTFDVITWEQQKETFLKAVDVERRVMGIILFFIIIVAGFGIFAILTMVVMEKAKDIGTLLAIGATRGGVMCIFMSLGSIIGVIGAGLGLLAGLGILRWMNEFENLMFEWFKWRVFPHSIYYLDHIPYEIAPLAVTLFTLGAVFTSFIASLYPAWRAAGLDPVQTLRYE